MKRLLIMPIAFISMIGCYRPTALPDATTIMKLESSIKPGDVPKPGSVSFVIGDYARYYAAYTSHGHRVIRGELIRAEPPRKAGVYIVRSKRLLPIIFDGGCNVVNLVYDIEEGRMVSLKCNGNA